MAKRSADKELNHDNWDDEEAPEEAGLFKTATPEVISKRVIRTAKRRMPQSGQEEKKNAFSSFAGFGTSTAITKKSDSAPAPSPFSFLSSTNGISKSPLSNLSNEKSTISSKDTECNVDYLSRLKGLNESVLDWLKMHISKNPCCILTPIFNDYNKYLEVIRKETENSGKKEGDEVDSETKQSPAKVSSESSKTTDDTAKPTLSTTTSTAPIFPPFKTDKNPWESIAKSSSIFANNSEDKEKSVFKLGQPASTTTSGFTFGNGKPFTFGNVAAPESSTTSSKPSESEDPEETDEPPKNEFKQVGEEGSIYSQRVKVFVKKDGNLSDRGVGMLYIKPVPNGKHQVIVRADTSLGNIIFNILLSENIPVQRVGKNNVMLMCIPTPESKPPPLPVFLKVKTSEDADKLFTELNKYRK